MRGIATIATYQPAWVDARGTRVSGPDEDTVTMAIEAGRAALGAGELVPDRVVFVSRQFPLLEGANAAVLLGGLGLPGTSMSSSGWAERPPPSMRLLGAASRTLIVAADDDPGAGACAVLVDEPSSLVPAGRIQRSLPLRARGLDGVVYQDDDPRLQRERGVRARHSSVCRCRPNPFRSPGWRPRRQRPSARVIHPISPPPGQAALGSPSVPSPRPEHGAWSPRSSRPHSARHSSIRPAYGWWRSPAPPRNSLPGRPAPGPDIKLAFTAYERAFEAKVRWEATRCRQCGTLALPPRFRCLECGSEAAHHLVELPRRAVVYTTTTVHVTVPGLASPYSLVVVEVDGVGVRTLATMTDAPAGSVAIGDWGRMVLRRVAVRSGVPDYGYAFAPEETA